MSIVVLLAGILIFIIMFSIVKKLLKFMFIALALLISLGIFAYLFLTGDGSVTGEYLPETQQQQINDLREGSKAKIKERTDAAKDAAAQKATELKDAAIEKVEIQVNEVVQETKEKVAETLGKEPASTTEVTGQESNKSENTDQPQ